MLPPALAAVRRAVREQLAALPDDRPRIIVALSGGPDSLALTAAVAVEAPKLGVAARAIIIDHGLQSGSAEVAARAADAARGLGMDAAVVAVTVRGDGGPENAAREARYAALKEAARASDASAVLLGHTLDDQAETVLLGLARGAGSASLSGMPPERRDEEGISWLRPLLALRRDDTVRACRDAGLDAWSDPHNLDPAYARVRVRQEVLPVLERELGPGIVTALARTAEQLREDEAAFREMIAETIEDIVEPAEAGIAISVAALAANPAALRHRIIRHVAQSEFGESLTRTQTLEIARLVTDWRGQGPIDLPGFTAARTGRLIVFAARGAASAPA